MNTSGERLKALLRECNLTASDFALQRKVTPQHVNNWFHRGVPLARMEEFANLLCVRTKWLRTGEGPKHHNPLPRLSRLGDIDEPEQYDHGRLATNGVDDVRVPFHRITHRTLEPYPERHLRLPRLSLDSLGVPHDQVIALTLQDYNMAPLMPYGTSLAVDLSFRRVVEGEVYALVHNGRLRIHTLTKRPNGALRLFSHDCDDYPCETYTPSQARSQGLEIVGWVFWWSQLRDDRPS